MDIASLCADMRKQIAELQAESRAYAEQIARGSDLFENSKAQSYSDGASEALSEMLSRLEEILDMDQSALEWDDTSTPGPCESGILS